MTAPILIFFLLSCVNVVLQTLKTIYTVNGTKLSAATINAITFGFYAVILKQISEFPLVTSVAVMVLTNFIGVYFVHWFLQITREDRIWKITVLTYDSQKEFIIAKLKDKQMDYIVQDLPNTSNVLFNIFSKSQTESSYIKEQILQYSKRVYVVELDKQL